jgi:predicted extracellular nuclease
LFASFVVPFLVAASPVAAAVSQIQGFALVSPMAGDSVSTTGVVTRVVRDGFYLQDPVGDAAEATSDAVFVRSPATVWPGDEVRVVARVDERPAGDSAYLTVTELTDARVTRLSAQVRLPPAVCIGRDERFPGADAVAFWESLEAMRVCVRSARVVQCASGDAVWVVADAAELSARGALSAQPGDAHPERVKLAAPGMPRLGVGDVLADVSGVVDYRAGRYEVLLDAPPAKRTGSLSREIATLPRREGWVRLVSFNLHNLGLGEPERMVEIARIVVSHLGAPEILGLEEVIDDSGSENDGVVDATLTLRALVDAIRAEDGPAYDFREVVPADGSDGGAPGSNIRQVLLFDRERVSFVDRGDVTGGAGTRFVHDGGSLHLTRSPGRIDPAHPAWVQSRKPLACELRAGGSTFFVIVCHFVSKSRSSPLHGAVQPPVDPDAAKRRRQAELVADFVGGALAADPDARVVVMGDLNDDWYSAPVAALEAGALADVWSTLPPRERYSYIFDGSGRTFDHVLVTPALAREARFDVVHVAAEFPLGVSDHDPVMASVHIAPDATAASPGLDVSSPFPNPFTGTVSLRVSGDKLAAAVFDAAGRLVTTVSAANGTVTWGGHDNAGRDVPAGVYLVRVSDGVSTRARKVLLIR